MARGAQWLSMAINITNSNACLIQTFHKSQISSEYSKTSVSASAVIGVYIINYYEHNSFQLRTRLALLPAAPAPHAGYCSDTVAGAVSEIEAQNELKRSRKEEEPAKPQFRAPPAPCYSA